MADRPRVVVVGLGPAGPELTTVGAVGALDTDGPVRLRTHRHPAAAPYRSQPSYDDRYETADTFDQVYAGIVDDLVSVALDAGQVTYAVPGSPSVLESAARRLRADPRVVVDLVPGMSFLDLAWQHLPVDPIEAGVTLVDGHRFAIDAAGATGALVVAHCHANHVLSDIKLAYEDDEPESAVILQRLGLPDERVVAVEWADIDRAVEADHLTSLYIPAVATPVANEVVRFHELVRTLRRSDPWDAEQTHESLARYLVEETYELIEAIEDHGADPATGDAHLEEELGDVLFQVVFHSVIAAEGGRFTLGDVARGIHDKLYARHPHVFGDAAIDDAGTGDAAVLAANWEYLKQAEKGRASVMDGIPRGLPALSFAEKVLDKAERIGVATPAPIDPDGALGSVLLGLVAHARAEGIDPEAALRGAVRQLRDEAMSVESAADD